MADDKFKLLGPMLANIGGEVAEIVGGNPDGAFLYVEAGEGWIGSAIFREEGKIVRYFDSSLELDEFLLEMWNAEDPDKRWAVMEYEVKGTTFDAKFQFPEEIDPKETEVERRPRALQRRFGDKPVVYPPWPEKGRE